MDPSIRFLHLLLDIGETMLSVGGEVNRVEDTLRRMGTAYGASRMNVFVITSSIIITMTLPDGREETQTRRIEKTGATDFACLEKLNLLSRRYCSLGLSEDQLRQELDAARAPDDSRAGRAFLYPGSMLAAGSFAVFFGGTVTDGIAASAFAVWICWLQERLGRFCPNKIVFNLLVSVLSGSVICAAHRYFAPFHLRYVMIGVIMLLIPGIAMTNSIRDILVGDTISGIMRFIETLFWSGALAMGFMLAIWIFGG